MFAVCIVLIQPLNAPFYTDMYCVLIILDYVVCSIMFCMLCWFSRSLPTSACRYLTPGLAGNYRQVRIDVLHALVKGIKVGCVFRLFFRSQVPTGCFKPVRELLVTFTPKEHGCSVLLRYLCLRRMLRFQGCLVVGRRVHCCRTCMEWPLCISLTFSCCPNE